MFQAKARLAEAISKRIEAENNLEISVSDFKKIVGRDPKINWFESNEKNLKKNLMQLKKDLNLEM